MDKWKTVKIGSVLIKASTENPNNNPNIEYSYIDISSINSEKYEIVSPKILLGKNAPSRARKSIQIGDVVFVAISE